jgi:ketosteroid isomerase-like protein
MDASVSVRTAETAEMDEEHSSVLSDSSERGLAHARLASEAAVLDTQRAMSEESTTPDLVQRARAFIDAFSRRDLDAVMTYFTPDAVWDLSAAGMETCTGAAAIRRFLEVWFGAYEELLVTAEELLDLGNGVVFVAYREDGRLRGSDAHVEQRPAQVAVFDSGLVSRMSAYLDVDTARTAAERLAEERG